MSALSGHLDALSQGTGGSVVVEGPFGMGKTRLLRTTALKGAERGLTVIAGQVKGTAQPIPLLINLLRHVMSGEADFDELVHPDRNPFWLMDRIGELIEKAASRHPLVIVLDDVQQTDDISGLALRGLVRSLASSPVLWLLARRPVPTRSLAQHAVGSLVDHATVRLRLERLDDDAVAELCADILGVKPDASVLRWAARCGGNPWLVENLFGSLVQAGQVVIMDGTGSVVAGHLPEGVLAAVDRLLEEMPPAVLRLLACGSRIGRMFPVAEAAALLGEPLPDVSSSADEAAQLGLVRRTGPELAFAHDVIVEALDHAASRGRDLAAAAAGSPAVSVAVAAAGSPAVPATAPTAAPRAGLSAAPAIGAAAADGDPHAQPGGRPSTGPGAHRSPTGAADVRTERPGGATPINAPSAPPPPSQSDGCGCDDMAARVISALGDQFDEAPRTLARALRLLAGSGRGAEAGRLADAALRPGAEAAAEARLVLELGHGLRDADCHGLAAWLLRRTLARQDICELDRAKLNRALTDTAKGVSGGMSGAGGGVPGVVTALRREPPAGLLSPLTTGREPRQAAAAPYGDACERPLWTWLIRALTATGQFDEATAVCTAVRQESEKHGEDWPEALWYGCRAEVLAAAGRLEEARTDAEAALRLADGSSPLDSVPARAVLARISIHRGDLATASDQLRMSERLPAGSTTADKAGLDWTLALFHAASGRPAMTVSTLINAEEQVVTDPLLFAQAPTAAATVVRLAQQLRLGAQAQRAAELVRRIAERNPAVQSLAGAAEHAAGVLHDDPAALQRAVELYRLAARPLAAGNALEDAARTEQSTRNVKTRAVWLLESARDLYLDCGAERDTARVEKKLRRLGVRNVRGPSADRPTSGWESLTRAELRVVRAIVDGKTNREAAGMLFLSPHTVDSHLRRVFSKLGINSRVELTKRFVVRENFPPAMSDSYQPGAAG
jgi:DNA-binding CsgD family transcriptional regulator/tetratricopeptide (TPR) repeat protein